MLTSSNPTNTEENMSNKAKNDKASIIVDLENLLDVFEPAFMRMPKIRRIHGAAVRMEDAVYDMIDHFYMAYELGTSGAELSEKNKHIAMMIGAFGRIQMCFKRLMKIDIDTQKKSDENSKGKMCLFSDSTKLAIARSLERLDEGIRKWRNALRSSRVMSNG